MSILSVLSRFLGRAAPVAALSAKEHQFLADTLRGNRPEQPCWANEDFQKHALTSVVEKFTNDFNWCLQVIIAIYLINPDSFRELDRIITEHVESRTGIFPPELSQGRGWNPAAALYFNSDARRYWRCYRAYTSEDWSSVEVWRYPTTRSDLRHQSGYRFEGTRGCVRRLELRHDVVLEDAASYAKRFVASGRRLLYKACRRIDTPELWSAIREQTLYDGQVDAVRVQFQALNLHPDRGEKPERRFRLMLEHL
jgi:hypothetical protein